MTFGSWVGDTMTQDVWTAVDKYITDCWCLPIRVGSLSPGCKRCGLPPIQVSPVQGKLLHLLARACGARQVLDRHARRLQHHLACESSARWRARGHLGGRSKHAEVARANFSHAGLTGVIELRQDPRWRPAETAAEGRGPLT